MYEYTGNQRVRRYIVALFVFLYTRTYSFIYTYIHIYIYIFIFIYIYIYEYTYIYVYLNTYIRIYRKHKKGATMYRRTLWFPVYSHIFIHIYIYIYIYISKPVYHTFSTIHHPPSTNPAFHHPAHLPLPFPALPYPALPFALPCPPTEGCVKAAFRCKGGARCKRSTAYRRFFGVKAARAARNSKNTVLLCFVDFGVLPNSRNTLKPFEIKEKPCPRYVQHSNFERRAARAAFTPFRPCVKKAPPWWGRWGRDAGVRRCGATLGTDATTLRCDAAVRP
jgi:hypothetical protein